MKSTQHKYLIPFSIFNTLKPGSQKSGNYFYFVFLIHTILIASWMESNQFGEWFLCKHLKMP